MLLANNRGFTTTFFALLMPVILAFTGLCADGIMVIYHKISLETASDAASLATIDSYDRDIWFNQQLIVLREEQARLLANEILQANLPGAVLVDLIIEADRPSVCKIQTQYEVPLMFLRIFGINSKTVMTVSTAHGKY